MSKHEAQEVLRIEDVEEFEVCGYDYDQRKLDPKTAAKRAAKSSRNVHKSHKTLAAKRKAVSLPIFRWTGKVG